MKPIYLILLVCVLGVSVLSVGIVSAVPTNDKAVMALTKQNDSIKREKQTFDIKAIEKGSSIVNTFTIVTLDTNIGNSCVLVLNESHLNNDEISEPFICDTVNSVMLNVKGNHALQSVLRSDEYNIAVKANNTDSLIPITSKDLSLTVFYKTPQYFAQVENGIVKNVIVADKEFIDTQSGTWIETTKDYSLHGKYAGIGDTYDVIKNKFIPKQPYQSWVLNINNGWESPVPYPVDGLNYLWDELTLSWVEYS